MIYNKLDGTTSNAFKIGKRGPKLENQDGVLKITEHGTGTERVVGIGEIRLATGVSEHIPTTAAVLESIDKKIRTVEDISQVDPLDSIAGDYFYVGK